MENNDIAALTCVVAPLTGAVLLAGVALLWLLYGFHELRLLFLHWLDRR